VANPPKLALPHFNVNVFFVGFFREFFFRDDSRPPNSFSFDGPKNFLHFVDTEEWLSWVV
jgi:hypothetical protein